MASSKRKRLQPHVLQFFSDIVVLFLGWFSIIELSTITVDESLRASKEGITISAVAACVTLFIMQRRSLYIKGRNLARTEEISRVFTSVLGGAGAAAVFAAFTDWYVAAWEIILGTITVFILRTLTRGLVRNLLSNARNANREKVVVVGTGVEAKELTQLILDHPEANFILAGVVGNLAIAEKNDLANLWIGPTGRLVEIMRKQNIDSAIITTTGFRGQRFRSIAKEIFRSGFDLHLTTGVSRMGAGRFDVKSIAHEPFIVVGHNAPPTWQYGAKRIIDIVGSSIAIILASPILVGTALAIWLQDRGPVTYTSQRTGHNGTFAMYKFRSMVTNAEELKKQMAEQNERSGPLFKVSNDPRITSIGKFIRETSIDELPQLFNVLKGDMSLVGPRPALPEEVKDFDDELQKRSDVRPGITGLWQVEARSNAAFNAYRRLDLHYVENWNIMLDLRIILATIEQVIVTAVLMPLRKIFKKKMAPVDAIADDVEPLDVTETIDLTVSSQIFDEQEQQDIAASSMSTN